ncbi:MAG: response regulator transcription factor [Alphaproteobacteria bacterium]|nr:response regulator transcription factor [Alphaproteobacteria bacterium]MCB9696883.1 response regulator transcription factor [Alphaproteobacteria bacterium]
MKDRVLLVDAAGTVLQANEHARELLDGEAVPSCRRALRATDHQGGPVCTERCATDLAHGGQTVDRLALVRGRHVRLVCRRVGRTLAVRSLEVDAPGATTLSERELEVLALVAHGETDPEAAAVLGLTVGTVRTHVENARRKLGVSTRSAAVAKALRLGLLR